MNSPSWSDIAIYIGIGSVFVYAGTIPPYSVWNYAYIVAGLLAGILPGVLDLVLKLWEIRQEKNRQIRTRETSSNSPSMGRDEIQEPAPATESAATPMAAAPLVEPMEGPSEPPTAAVPYEPSEESQVQESSEDEEENNFPTLPPTPKPLSGKRICVTGRLPYSRRDVEDFIKGMGGFIASTATRNTDYLITGEDAGFHRKRMDARLNNVPMITWPELMALCGLPKDANIFRLEYYREQHKQRRSAEEGRMYGKEFARRVNLLTDILTSSVSDLLPKVVQIVTRVDDELELCHVNSFRSTPRGELILLSTEGEAIYLNDLTGDSLVRLLSAYGR